MPPRRRTELLAALGLVPVVLALLVLQAMELRSFAQRQIGIVLDEPEEAPGTVRILDVAPGLPADRAGVRAGDLLRSVNGYPVTDLDQLDGPRMEALPGRPLRYGVERNARRLELRLVPGTQFPIFVYTVSVVTVLCWLTIGPLALAKRPGYLRARLLFLLSAAVAVELALPGIRSMTSLLLPLSVMLNGFQMGVELHLASVIPEKQRWLHRRPWVIPGYYVLGLGSASMVAAVLLLERAGWRPLPWSGEELYDRLVTILFPLWALGVLALLTRQALTYPEPKGRQQAALVALGTLPWATMQVLDYFGLFSEWVPGHWQDVAWNAALLLYPLAVFVILWREAANQERILLSLADEVQHVGSVAEISRVVSNDLHEAFHPKSTHVFYRQRHSRDLRLGHSTGIGLREEQIPESSVLLRLVEAYGKATDYPGDLAGLPPEERAWLDRLEARLVVPLAGRDGRLLGLLVLGNKKSEEPYTPRDRKLLQAITNQIALVYENARLKDRVEQTQRVQREVMARLGEQELGLVRECPVCGACADAGEERCPHDGSELQQAMPVERVILGRYRLDRRIARGGMGAIYAARDLHLQRPVAVKVLYGSLAGEEVARRFEAEARLTASLRHPNVVTVYDYGTTGMGASFLVMELLAGFTLASAIAREGRLAPGTLAGWMEQVCDGVEAAHRAGIVHRDLKPANVFVTAAGEQAGVVKILDFGVAKVRSAALAASAGMTAPGSVIGTFHYMAPEQLSGGEVDERSDVFALGVVTVEALTGRRPFPGAEPGELLATMAKGPHLDPVELGSERLAAVLRRCLALDPAARFPSVAALRAELVPALQELAARAPVEP